MSPNFTLRMSCFPFLSRSSLVNEVIPELKTSVEELKEECYAHLDEKVHSPAVALESFVRTVEHIVLAIIKY